MSTADDYWLVGYDGKPILRLNKEMADDLLSLGAVFDRVLGDLAGAPLLCDGSACGLLPRAVTDREELG